MYGRDGASERSLGGPVQTRATLNEPPPLIPLPFPSARPSHLPFCLLREDGQRLRASTAWLRSRRAPRATLGPTQQPPGAAVSVPRRDSPGAWVTTCGSDKDQPAQA